MKVLRGDKVAWFDVDDTLILWSKEGKYALGDCKYDIHEAHVELIKEFHARGHRVVVWSQGGYRWACKAVKLLDISKYVDLVMSKPEWVFDDKPSSKWMPPVDYLENA